MSANVLHPHRYPKHDDPDKGQVYGGICNRTACHRSGAVFWNAMTYGLYCRECAHGINFEHRLCRLVKKKPGSIEEMDAIYRKTQEMFLK